MIIVTDTGEAVDIEIEMARERLVNQVLDATTLPEIAQATQALRFWLRDHHEDVGLTDGFEQLAMMQEAAEWQERERREQSASVSGVSEAVG